MGPEHLRWPQLAAASPPHVLLHLHRTAQQQRYVLQDFGRNQVAMAAAMKLGQLQLHVRHAGLDED